MAQRPDSRNSPAQARGPVDWDELRRRIDAAGRSLTGETQRSPEAVRELLEKRSRQLARRDDAVSQDTVDAVTFELAGETYAIAAEHITGVFPLNALTPVPGANNSVLGITEWRGDLLTLLDLRRLLGLPVTGLNDLAMVVVLGTGLPAYGVLADAVTGLTSIVMTDVHVPDRGAAVPSGHVRGLTGSAMIVLDGESLLSSSLTRSG